jgi:hypothetical protein
MVIMDVRDLIPQHKMDHERTEKLKKLDKGLIRSVIPELMIWLKDGNWPVFSEVRDILLPLEKELVPHIKNVLVSNDGEWKYFVLTGLVSKLSKGTIAELKQDLLEVANNPSVSDKASEVDAVAKEILSYCTNGNR